MTINAEELKLLIRENKVIIIDVREQEEYEEAHIQGAHLLPLSCINLEQVNEIVEKEGEDKIVAFQCRSGARSKSAIDKILDEADEKDIKITFEYKNVIGGIIACKNVGIFILED